MAASSEQMLIESPPSRTEIDLEDLSRQTRLSADGGRRPFQQHRNRSLAMRIAENFRVDVSLRQNHYFGMVITKTQSHAATRIPTRSLKPSPATSHWRRTIAKSPDDPTFAQSNAFSCIKRLMRMSLISPNMILGLRVSSGCSLLQRRMMLLRSKSASFPSIPRTSAVRFLSLTKSS